MWIEEKAYRQFYMHGLGQWLGLDVHDVGRYDDDRSRTLEVGMIITVEPGIYVSGFGGVRIEDMVVVTEDGCRNLAHSPKELIEVPVEK